MKKRCSSHRGDRRRYITRARYVVVDEGDTAEHRLRPSRRERARGASFGILLVPVKRAYLIDRNKYSPKTANRPKEAMKAARRAQP